MKKIVCLIGIIGIVVCGCFFAGCAETVYGTTVSQPPKGTAPAPSGERPTKEASSPPAAAQTAEPGLRPEELAALEEPLAALLAASVATGEAYGPRDDYGTMYLHMLADMFYLGEDWAEIESQEYSEFVKFTSEQVRGFLKTAFGDGFQEDQLVKSSSLIVQDGNYYFGVGDSGISASVQFQEAGAEAYRYTYSVQIPGMDAVNGTMDVQISEQLEIQGYALSEELPKIGG